METTNLGLLSALGNEGTQKTWKTHILLKILIGASIM